MQVFDPTRGMNAFAQGAQMGGVMRQAKTDKMVAPAIAQGDYGQAADIYGQRGDAQGAQFHRTQYESQLAGLSEAQKAEAAREAAELQNFAFSMKGIEDPAQRQQAYMQAMPMLRAMEIDVDSMGDFYLNDEALDLVLGQAVDLQEALKPYTLSPGSVRMQGGQEIANNPSQEGPASSMGKLAADLQAGRITPEQYQFELQRMQRPANSVTVNNSMGGGGENPYANLPDGTMIEGPPGTANLTGGQYWTVQGGRPVIANAQGGAAEDAIQEAETKRLGRQASTQRAGATVVREVGRGLELMPRIIGWGEARPGGETDTTRPGEVVTANARIVASKIPGTAEYQFLNNIASALSNVGLDRLQEMRNNSPTGGALGQVPVQQQQRLEQVLGAFKIGMPRPVIEENLKYMNNAYMDIMYGSRPEREALVRQGRLDPQENQQIQEAYHDLNWDRFGRMSAPPAAIDALRANPGLQADFDGKYGEGAAAQFLGGR